MTCNKFTPSFYTCEWLCLDLVSCGIYPLDCPHLKNMRDCKEYSVSPYAYGKWRCSSATLNEIEAFKKDNPDIQIG